MTYDLEAINTLFAQIAECMHRNPARAMRLLGQAKAKVGEALERAALAAHKPDGGDAKDADPMQGAADWLVAALAKPRPTEIAARLLIGYNRAERLYDAAMAQQRQGEGGE